ncbi:MAG TPA: sigma-70 family RNA polymerase sigma factor [Longimicrobiales bacterium]|nr:sigma-70 family RNA polymerase sigma factor [Longimicrobiales bacterium]
MDFDALFHRLYPSLFRYLNRLTGDIDVAEDIAQEAFVRLLAQDLPEAEARPWLFAVATNLVRDRARKQERRQRLLKAEPVLPAPSPRPDEVVERGEQVERVRAALGRLAPRDQQLLLMREEGFTYEEMARTVGVAPSSVGTLIARALRRFAGAYAQEAGNDPRE